MFPILPLLGILFLASPQAPKDAPKPPDETIDTSETPPPLLLVDPDAHPTVTLAWTTAAGERIELAAERAYGADADRTPLGHNIACYLSVGGTRLTKGAGHPKGAVVRVGFYKIDATKPFFDHIAEGSTIDITLAGVTFNQPVQATPDSIVQHLKFGEADLKSCGIPGEAKNQYNTVSPTETLNDRIRQDKDARLGVLGGRALDKEGDDPGLRGAASIDQVDPDTLTLHVSFAYPLLRHLQDPWQSGVPGTFLEPYHFHVEFEALPEGTEPMDLAKLRAEKARIDAEMRARGERPNEPLGLDPKPIPEKPKPQD